MNITFNQKQVMVYQILSSGLHYEPVDNMDQLRQLVLEKKQLWVDVVTTDAPELILAFRDLFKLHSIVIDDINHLSEQRPKVQVLDKYIFWINRLYSISGDNQFLLKKMATVLQDNVVLTFRMDRDDNEQHYFKQINNYLATYEQPKADYLALLLLFLMLEEAYQTIDSITENLEGMEELLIESPKSVKLSDIYIIKRRMLVLRKLVEPIIEISSLLSSEKVKFIESNSQIFLRKLHNNSLRASDILDFYQQMISYIFDMYLSATNSLTNRAVTLLTQFSTVFIPITFIVGVYGMNFKYMPELDMKYAYPAVWGLMAAIAGGMIYFFKKHQEY